MINYDLSKIRAIFFDVDGVLSTQTITLASSGEPLRSANIKDGYAIQLAQKQGLIMGIITGGKIYDSLKEKYQLKDEEIIYVGDDIPDYEIMRVCGCACCPKDAAPEIKEISCYISDFTGGNGCGRDIIEQVLKAQGKWMESNIAFGW